MIDIEIINFFRPDDDRKNIFVSCIPTILDEGKLHVMLRRIFSQFGSLFEVQVLQSGATCDDDSRFQYAFVKYYSARCAAAAMTKLKGQLLIEGHLCKLKYARRKKQAEPKCLHFQKCFELANFYLGFNGWTVTILSVKDIKEKEQVGLVGFICQVNLVTQDGITSRGSGISTQTWTITDAGSHGVAICRAKKQAYQFAVEDAFSQLVMVTVVNDDSLRIFVELTSSAAPGSDQDCPSLLKITEVLDNCVSDEDDAELNVQFKS